MELVNRIADSLKGNVDYLVGEGQNAHFDKQAVKRLEEIANLSEKEKDTVLTVYDALIRDFKTRRAYTS